MSSSCTMITALSFAFAVIFFCPLSFATEVTYDNRAIKIDGERKLIISGSIHYPRSMPEMWQSLIRKSKDGGLNAIETYVFWNAHEPQQRQYDFSGNLDLVRFIKTVQEEGLYAILRIGPYVCAEWNYGGLPVWLHALPGIEMRTNNDVYKKEMEIFTTKIVDMMREHELFASQGGPIILAQIENEYGNVEWGYGDEGWKYVQWCANLAESYHVDIPWIMCQQDNAPAPMISTCNGYYCDQWHPKRNDTPKIWTENWSGWFKGWGAQDPHRTAEDLAFAVARFYQLGGSLQNYYMYHGGTNFGHTAGGPYITTSYDYDAPLDEYGNLNQPKWGHLKDLHFLLRSMEKTLTYGDRVDHDYGNLRQVTVYSYQGKRSCFFSNSDGKNDFQLNFEGNAFTVPAWSVSILPDCFTEAYSTAKVNSQTSMMVKVPNEADDNEEPYKLEWVWRSEHAMHLDENGFLKRSTMTAKSLVDQKTATNGTSDYLWVLTNINHDKADPVWGKAKEIILHVHTDGPVLHVFLNGKHVGSKYAEYGHLQDYIYEKAVKLKQGNNRISILSVTVGLPNYGPHFDKSRIGVRGPIKLIAKGAGKDGADVVNDISTNEWVFKSGLHGEDLGLPDPRRSKHRNWYTDRRPANKMMVWYRTTFKAPLGTDPVVVDLQGLGKGTAWVNGFNIGRYWPRYLAPERGCDIHCDYRGAYGASKCLTNCGKPSQRWYHIPRSLLKDDDNVLVLFEEHGGTPDLVNFQTVTIGKVCANAYEGNTLELSCQGGRRFSRINFASFGLPQGTCGNYKGGKCGAAKSKEIVENACLGRERCTLQVTEETFGPLRCKADAYRLAVEATC